ncbi:MAG: small multi-drug export protein [Nanoarchaeota archaeon]|nr:small multi-drug export protein [Nanoarchaeota archaeon]
MSVILNEIFLSILPISELRGGITYAIGSGLDPFLAYFVGVLSNFFVIPICFFFLDNLHKYFLGLKIYRKLFDKYINKNRRKLEKYVGTKAEFWALFCVVMIPLPLTGAYTGSILAWFFGLKRRKSYLAISLGILIAGILVTLISLGVFR